MEDLISRIGEKRVGKNGKAPLRVDLEKKVEEYTEKLARLERTDQLPRKPGRKREP